MSQKACTCNELAQFKRSDSDSGISFSPLGDNFSDDDGDNSRFSVYTSVDAIRMHGEIASSASMCDKMSISEQQQCWKNCTEDCKAVFESNLPRRSKKDFEREVNILRTKYLSELRPPEAVGRVGGIEMCASNNDQREKRAARYLSSTDYRKGNK